MIHAVKTALAFAIAFAVCGPTSAQEKVDEPMYASWSKFKIGTSIKMTIVRGIGGGKTPERKVMTVKLVEVSADKIVVENSYLTGDDAKATPPVRQEIPKIATLPKGISKEDFKKCPYGKILEEGVETLKIGGAEYRCRRLRLKTIDNYEGTIWTSDEIPGAIAKVEARKPGETANNTMEVSEIKKP